MFLRDWFPPALFHLAPFLSGWILAPNGLIALWIEGPSSSGDRVMKYHARSNPRIDTSRASERRQDYCGQEQA